MNLNPTNINIIKRLLIGRSNRPLKTILNRTAPADLATLLLSFNEREQRLLLDALMGVERLTEALLKVPEAQVSGLLKVCDRNRIAQVLEDCPEDHAAWILAQVETTEREEFSSLLSPLRNRRLQQLLSYPEDSAGRIMDTQAFSLPERLRAQDAIDLIRKRAEEQESFYYMYTTDESGLLTGVLSLRNLTQAPADKPLSDLINREIISVRPETLASEVAKLVDKYDFVAVPVVDAEKRLLGIITVDDVLDIIQEQTTAEIYASAGLQQDDRVYIPARQSIKYRAPWMLLNLGTAFAASSVVNMFQETLGKLIILAVFNNVVAGIGGNTAIQSVTVVTRGLATGDFNFTTARKVILKEVLVGLALGLYIGLAAGVVIFVWKKNILVAGAIFCAIIINSLIASSVGASIPVLLNRYKLDPATGSGVIVTTFTDVFGFMSFLGIATLFLKLFGAQL